MNWRKKVIAAALVTVIGALFIFGAFYLLYDLSREGDFSYVGDDEKGTGTLGPGTESPGEDDGSTGGFGDEDTTGIDGPNGSFRGDDEELSGNITPSTDGSEDEGGQTIPGNGETKGFNEGTLRDDDEEDPLVSWVGGAMAAIVFLVLISLLVFSFTRIRSEELLKQKRRLAIYRYIIDHPGDHFRAVQRAVGLQVGVLSHHINLLEKEQLIVSEQDGNNRRFYAAGVKRNNGEVRLSRIQENILKTIQGTPGITQSQIAKDLGVNRKVVFYNVKFLSGSGIVTEQKVRRRAHYYPNRL